jgi:hypothetical protein
MNFLRVDIEVKKSNRHKEKGQSGGIIKQDRMG